MVVAPARGASRRGKDAAAPALLRVLTGDPDLSAGSGQAAGGGATLALNGIWRVAMRCSRSVGAALVAVLSVSPVFPQEQPRTTEAPAFAESRAAAERGDAEAQYRLGLSYVIGVEVPEDVALAAAWFRRAAEQGHAAAQSALGVAYDDGDGVQQDHAAAVAWYRRAAAQGHAGAQNNLGFMYATGRGVPRGYAEAVAWWRRAAERGNAVALYNLGLAYASGDGVPLDYTAAHMWLSLAGSRGDGEAGELRDILSTRMTRAQVTEAQRLAREWRPAR